MLTEIFIAGRKFKLSKPIKASAPDAFKHGNLTHYPKSKFFEDDGVWIMLGGKPEKMTGLAKTNPALFAKLKHDWDFEMWELKRTVQNRLEAEKARRLALRAKSMATNLTGAPDKIMFAPAGDHKIDCGCGPNGIAAAELVVRVDKSTAAVLNASLDKLNFEIAPQRCLFDFEHEGRQAMAWPMSFEWQNAPNPGVYATVEYSKLGREYVEGKVVRAFSGSFYTDADLPKNSAVKAGKTYKVEAGKRGSEENPARMIGLVAPYCGTLTNNPAFTKLTPLWSTNKS